METNIKNNRILIGGMGARAGSNSPPSALKVWIGHLRKSLALLAIAGALIANSHAAAVPDEAKLTIIPAGNGQYSIIVAGHASITGVGAEFNVSVILYGDDTWFDDRLYSQNLNISDNAGNFSFEFNVNHSVLNEDWGQNEIYATAFVKDRNGRSAPTM